MNKQDIRFAIKQLKKTLSHEQRDSDALIVKNKIETSLWFKNASNILTYNSLPDELDTKFHIQCWTNIKNLYLPRVNGNNLEILRAGETTIGSFNILEPTGNDVISPSEIELAIIPGIAFSHNGIRLGRGKGYYDRLLCNMNVLKIGICYDFQLIEELPCEVHDICMDAIITPNHTLIINSKQSWI